MQKEIHEYIAELDRLYQTEKATEHSYRSALQSLLSAMLPNLNIVNEPKRQSCGAPDYVLSKENTPIAFVETKDIHDPDLAGKNKNKEQFDRYKNALDTIVFTDYLQFHFHKKGESEGTKLDGKVIRIAEVQGKNIKPIKENLAPFESLITRFGEALPQTIDSADKLAEVLAKKAWLMADVVEQILSNGNGGKMSEYLGVFEKMLIHDITPKKFADMYAQTIAYGMFAARWWCADNHFVRERIATLIPKTNPFLRELFHYIAGLDIDKRILWIVNDLVGTLKTADMEKVKQGFGEGQDDPMVHFYEHFLAAYNPTLRKSRGVWFTPKPAVSFIVRAVDDILKTEFGLPGGLADKTKVRNSDMHKVQILDPAVGTGAFLVETIRQIHDKYKNQQGKWAGYVEEHLIPRLNGFEVLMAPYTMAHINLAWILEQTGYQPDNGLRYRVFLTNSLEGGFDPQPEKYLFPLFANEVNAANFVKQDTPVMVVMANPPYSGESQNKNHWIDALIADYKKEPDTNVPLKERNSKWINNDYCKFIRLGQSFVEKNSEGVLAYVNSNSFIDSPIFRGMRRQLLKTFDTIYVLDLHGNSKKREVCPDGSKDENIFDITEGVSINIFVKTGRKSADELATVFHCDIFGRRAKKYAYLQDHRLQSVKWKKLKLSAPQYVFVPKKTSQQKEYGKGFCVQELFPVNSVGIVTARDSLTIHYTKEELVKTIKDFVRLDTESARKHLGLGNDARDWSIAGAKKDLTASPDFRKIVQINYRPFDKRLTYYTGNSKGFHCMPRDNVMRHFLMERPREKVMRHFLEGENVGLITIRRSRSPQTWNFAFLSDCIVAGATAISSLDINYVFPLYLYLESDGLVEEKNRKPNLDMTIVSAFADSVQLTFEEEKSGNAKKFAPIDMLDYIYAVLHSPAYRERYKEFLKIDFPRVPYPQDAKSFRKLAKLGETLRRLHLFEGIEPKQGLANYAVSGSDVVERVHYSDGKVWINETQCFDRVPVDVWDFYIGGYQPAQKWLKDRKDRTLSYDDKEHYQKIVCVLQETIKLMSKADEAMRS